QSQGRGPSNAARYIAGSKIDPEREGGAARPLFTNRGDDSLSYGEANRYLKDGRGRPAKGDLIHFSVSFEPADFEQLGETDEERKGRLREAAREAMEQVRADVRAAEWRWVSGIHLNTSHPHLHFLIFKGITGEDGKERRLGKIPKDLLARRQQNPDGPARPVEGVIGNHFVRALERALGRAREAEHGKEEKRARTQRDEESEPSRSNAPAQQE